ncbi:uncharacterized protein LOC142234405 [Haematobia irritans]|uniref:uncharacterized protein LOC142234405 n=1 Tax=Haematobia irritans TaxID=7368 RepID=UPI003F5035AB
MKTSFTILPFMAIVLQTHIGQSAIILNPKLNQLSQDDDGFLELRPNGTLILRSTMESSSNALQQALLFKTILNAIRHSGNSLSDLSVKIYGEGIEHKFPPFLERVIQRIQTYFSVYKYTDTRDKNKPTTPINDSHYPEIDINLGSDNGTYSNKTMQTTAVTTVSTTTTTTTKTKATTKPTTINQTKVTIKPMTITMTETTTSTNDKLTTAHAQPSLSTASTSQLLAPVTQLSPANEENEFIELKSHQMKGKS